MKEAAARKREARAECQRGAESVEEVRAEEPESGTRKTAQMMDPRVPSVDDPRARDGPRAAQELVKTSSAGKG